MRTDFARGQRLKAMVLTSDEVPGSVATVGHHLPPCGRRDTPKLVLLLLYQAATFRCYSVPTSRASAAR